LELYRFAPRWVFIEELSSFCAGGAEPFFDYDF